jgi:hypothetical protein
MTGIKAIVWGIILTFGSVALIWLLSMLTVVSV